jgi:hypothetical protein
MYDTPFGAGSDVHSQCCVELDLQRVVEVLDARDDISGPKLLRL